ncbi:hypothetical protein SAMN05444673_2315 [Bacillus sp. OV166]|nr:hypothetical protein SAMN05444673_2315 [Bacillus sp. OV166]
MKKTFSSLLAVSLLAMVFPRFQHLRPNWAVKSLHLRMAGPHMTR